MARSLALTLALLGAGMPAAAEQDASEPVAVDAVSGEVEAIPGDEPVTVDAPDAAATVTAREGPTPSRSDAPEEIVITGTRIRGVSDNGAVKVETIDNLELRERGGRNLADALVGEAGLQLTSQLGTGRGILIDGLEEKYVLVLIDGRPVHGRVNSTLDFSRIPVDPENVERIEIVRGPMSAMYGSEAIAGVINIITRKPEEYFEASISGDTQLLPGEVAEGRSPLRNTLAGHVSGTLYDTAVKVGASGVWARLYDRHGDNKIDLQGRREGTVSIEAQREMLERLDLGLRADGSNVRVDTRVSGDQPFDDRVRDVSAGVGLFGEWRPTGKHRVRFDLRGDHYRHQSIRVTEPTPGAERENIRSDSTQRRLRAEASYELPVWRDLPGVHSLAAVVGATGILETVERLDGDGNSTLSDEAEGGRRAGSFFGEAIYSPWQPLTVTPGARLDISSGALEFGDAVDADGNPTDVRSVTSVVLNPKIGLRVAGPWGTALRASYGEGFRLPDFTERYLVFDHSELGYIVLGNPTLRPEKSRGFRLGGEVAPWDGVKLDVEGYLNLFRNKIDFADTGELRDVVPVFEYRNYARVFTSGVTTSLSLRRIIDTLSFTAAYQYLINAVDSSDCPDDDPYFCSGDEGARSLPMRPIHSAHLKVSWSAERTGTHLHAHLEYLSKRPIDDDVAMAAYGILGIGARQEIGERFEASLLFDNLLDAYHRIHGPKPGRSILLGLRARY